MTDIDRERERKAQSIGDYYFELLMEWHDTEFETAEEKRLAYEQMQKKYREFEKKVYPKLKQLRKPKKTQEAKPEQTKHSMNNLVVLMVRIFLILFMAIPGFFIALPLKWLGDDTAWKKMTDLFDSLVLVEEEDIALLKKYEEEKDN
jgi:hypothetical protein